MAETSAEIIEKAEFEQFLVFRELEENYNNSQIRYSDKELFEIFPEAKGLLAIKIKEWYQAKRNIVNSIRNQLAKIKQLSQNDTDYWFGREMIKLNEGVKLLEAERQIARLKRLQYVASGQQPKGYLTDEQINLAKEMPIADLYEGKLRRSGTNLFGLCPFHQEKHPSFTIYQKTNSCWCFGCQQGGNSIKFVMLLHDYSFKEAVKYLIGL